MILDDGAPIFQYGNYYRYYGYRNETVGDDIRLRAMKKEWFEGKDVLDVGCNVGPISITIARDFGPRRVLGIDIDNHLIATARKNIRHYIDGGGPKNEKMFPKCVSKMFGSLQPQSTIGIPNVNQDGCKSQKFPYNIAFQQENYVLESDELLDCVREEYDAILCLSLTKWIHLNFGDDGLKRFFRRSYCHLRPGGVYILEPQPWSSYKRKMILTEKIAENARNIRFLPEQFKKFLLTDVGYSSVEDFVIPNHHLKGFQRPILVFRKGTKPTSTTIRTECSTPPIPMESINS